MEYMESKMQEQIEAGISEADRCYARIAEIEEQNAALAATVEALRDAGNGVYAELQQWALTESHKETDRVFAIWRKAMTATPQQHLAEIRAQAGRHGYMECADDFGVNKREGNRIVELAANDYADSIRQEKK